MMMEIIHVFLYLFCNSIEMQTSVNMNRIEMRIIQQQIKQLKFELVNFRE